MPNYNFLVDRLERRYIRYFKNTITQSSTKYNHFGHLVPIHPSLSRLPPKLAPPRLFGWCSAVVVTGLLAATDPFFFSVSFVSFVTPVPILCVFDLRPYLACGTRPFVVRDYFDVHVVSLVLFVLWTMLPLVLGWSVFCALRVWAFTFGAALKCIFPLEISAPDSSLHT